MGHRIVDRRSRKKKTIYGPANQEMRRGERTVYGDPEKGMSMKTVARVPVPTQPSSKLPVYSIRRPFNTRAFEAFDWENFLADTTERNRDRGTALAVGELALEYVSPQSLIRMLSAHPKYSSKFGDSHGARSILRGFARDFNAHMREKTQQASDAAFEVAHGPLHPASKMRAVGDELLLLPDDGSVLIDTTTDGYYDAQDRFQDETVDWGHGVFRVGTLRKCGELAYGFDLSDNEQFDREFNGIRCYLRSEGLNTNLMPAERPGMTYVFTPAVPFFVQDGPGAVLQYAEVPLGLPLYPPAARDIS